MKSLLCAALLSALVLPVSAQTTSRFSASVGSFFASGKTGDRYSYTGVTFQPNGKHKVLPAFASFYFDTMRRKQTTGTGTSAVSNIQSMQGLGVVATFNILPFKQPGFYEILGVGIYQRHVANGTISTTGYAPGGKFGIGYDYKKLFIVADYTAVGRIKGTSPTGIGLRVGVRL
jgi:hypothetical protein